MPETAKIILDETRLYLVTSLKNGGFSDAEDIVGLYEKQPPAVNDKSQFLKRLIESSYNRQMGQTVIGKPIRTHQSAFDALVCHYDARKIIARWNRSDKKLLRKLRQMEIAGPGRKGAKKPGLWTTFCKSVVDAAAFTAAIDLKTLRRELTRNDLSRIGAVCLIASNIRGFGNALAADALKEAGFLDTVKPDVHMKKLGKLLGWEVRNETDLLIRMNKLCRESHVRPYVFDKLVWLAFSPSANFYKHEAIKKKLARLVKPDNLKKRLRTKLQKARNASS